MRALPIATQRKSQNSNQRLRPATAHSGDATQPRNQRALANDRHRLVSCWTDGFGVRLLQIEPLTAELWDGPARTAVELSRNAIHGSYAAFAPERLRSGTSSPSAVAKSI
jgi:hypothetical protein